MITICLILAVPAAVIGGEIAYRLRRRAVRRARRHQLLATPSPLTRVPRSFVVPQNQRRLPL